MVLQRGRSLAVLGLVAEFGLPRQHADCWRTERHSNSRPMHHQQGLAQSSCAAGSTARASRSHLPLESLYPPRVGAREQRAVVLVAEARRLSAFSGDAAHWSALQHGSDYPHCFLQLSPSRDAHFDMACNDR